MTVLWIAGFVNLLILSIEDIYRFRVSLWLLLTWIGISAALNYPFTLDVLTNFVVLLVFFASLQLYRYIRKKALGMGWGDWVFLLGLIFHFPVTEFVLFTLVSHITGLLYLFMAQWLSRRRGVALETKKVPMVGVYAWLFMIHKLIAWSN